MNPRLLLPVVLAATSIPPLLADDSEEALAQLENSAASFVEAFNNEDAQAISKLFAPDAEVYLASGGVLVGPEEIEDYYEEAFAGDADVKVALEAEAVRLITPDVAIEEGTLHFTYADSSVSSHLYTAVQVKQDDGSWLTARVRDELGDLAPPEEKLLALEWLVGDWLIEQDGTRTFVSFDWSDHGPFIDAKASTEVDGVATLAATLRIGFDPASGGFRSWSFDAGGGFNTAEWTETGDDQYLLRASGTTAEGETNVFNRTLAFDAASGAVTLTTRDHLIDGELQPDSSVELVKRPPAPAAASTE